MNSKTRIKNFNINKNENCKKVKFFIRNENNKNFKLNIMRENKWKILIVN